MTQQDDIRGFFDAYRFLSNFWPCSVRYGGLDFPTVENAYQAAKCADPAAMPDFVGLSPGDAKKLGGSVDRRADWDDIRVAVMRDLLAQKFADPGLGSLLLATGECELVEDNTWDDRFWGVCDGVGENTLGRLLMVQRCALAASRSPVSCAAGQS